LKADPEPRGRLGSIPSAGVGEVEKMTTARATLIPRCDALLFLRSIASRGVDRVDANPRASIADRDIQAFPSAIEIV
jgi:hypothetical protein